MSDNSETDAIMNFVRSVGTSGLESTGARVVEVKGYLYNVEDSTHDPKKVPGHEGKDWKSLLIDKGIPANSQCYVTNAPAPPGKSHPDFSVGGHMTTNQNGQVPKGGTCYLMPLCFWHNNSSRDRTAFQHTLDEMLELTGYMKGELALTFQVRLPSSEPFALLFSKDGVWNYRDVSQSEAESFVSDPSAIGTDHYVLIERVRGERTLHYIRNHNLPV
jgi:hypothetical protein